MVTVKLISNTGEQRTLSVKTDWQDITLAEYIDMQGKSETEILTILSGLDAATLAALDGTTLHYLSELLTGLQALPNDSFDLNIEYETIGQLETAKSFLKRLYKQNPDTYKLEVLPILYGLYKAGKVNGQWNNAACMALAEKAKLLPVSEVLPFAMHIIEEINRVVEKEKRLADDEVDPDMEEAGAGELERFGFYPTLNALTGGDLLKQEEVLQLSVIKVHTHLHFLKTSAEIQKNLSEIKRQTVAA